MRLILGIILGCAITVGVAYMGDATASSDGKQMVNWDVVAKRVDAVTALAREGWKRIAALIFAYACSCRELLPAKRSGGTRAMLAPPAAGTPCSRS